MASASLILEVQPAALTSLNRDVTGIASSVLRTEDQIHGAETLIRQADRTLNAACVKGG